MTSSNPVQALPVGTTFVLDDRDYVGYRVVDTGERDAVSIVTEHEVKVSPYRYGETTVPPKLPKIIQQRGELSVQVQDDGTIVLNASQGALQITPISRNAVSIRIVA